MIDCVTSELKEVKDDSLIEYVAGQVGNATLKELYDTYNDTRTTSPQYKEEEEEEEEDKEEDTISKVQEIFDHYNSKGIITHKRLNSPMKTAINARLKDYTFKQIIEAIDNYAIVYLSDEFWFDSKYALADLMRDKDVRKFINDAEPLVKFKVKNFNKQNGMLPNEQTNANSDVGQNDFCIKGS